MKSIQIPKNVKSIGFKAFANCSNITKIYSDAVVPPTVASDFPNYSATLYVPAESLEAYKTAEYWKNFINITSMTSSVDEDAMIDNGYFNRKRRNRS